MTFLYLLFIPFALWSVVTIYQLRAMKRHDRVLFRFCQIRRDTMAYLRSNYETLTKEDYDRSLQLLEQLNATIHFYDEHKISTFNVRPFVVFLRTMKNSAEHVDCMAARDRGPVAVLSRRCSQAFTFAFFSFTPWIKSEVTFRIVVLLVKHFGTEGFNQVVSLLTECLERAKKHPETRLGGPQTA